MTTQTHDYSKAPQQVDVMNICAVPFFVWYIPLEI